MSKFKLGIDVNKESYSLIKCKQNDDLSLEVSVYEDGAIKNLDNAVISVQAKKPNNTFIIQTEDITKSNNIFNIDLIKDFTRSSGTVLIEIVIVENQKQKTTSNIILDIASSVISGSVESDNTVTILENLESKIVEATLVKEITEELIQNGGAATKGDLQQVNSQLEQSVSYINDISIPARAFKTNNNSWYDAVQSSINSLQSGGRIILPSGVLDFGDKTLVINKSGVKLIGAGRDVTKIKSNAPIGIRIGTSIDGSIGFYGIELEGFTLEGCKGDGIQFNSIADSIAKNICVQNCTGNGFSFNYSWSNTMFRCRANRNNRGVYNYNASHALSLLACNLTHNTLEGLYNQVSNGINIIGGSIEQNDKGICVLNTRGISITGVYFEANKTFDLELGASGTVHLFANGFSVTGNYFNANYGEFTAQTSIKVGNGKGLIEGNSFRDYTGRAIYITGVKGIGSAKYISCRNNSLENVANMFSLDGSGSLAYRSGTTSVNSDAPKVLNVNDYDGLYIVKLSTSHNAKVWFGRSVTNGTITLYTDSSSDISVNYELSTIGVNY